MPKVQEDRRMVKLAQEVHLTRDDMTRAYYPPGLNMMPARDADHWYVKNMTLPDDGPDTVPGDEAHWLALQKIADQKTEEAAQAQQAANEAKTQFMTRQAQLQASPAAEGQGSDTRAKLQDGTGGDNATAKPAGVLPPPDPGAAKGEAAQAASDAEAGKEDGQGAVPPAEGEVSTGSGNESEGDAGKDAKAKPKPTAKPTLKTK